MDIINLRIIGIEQLQQYRNITQQFFPGYKILMDKYEKESYTISLTRGKEIISIVFTGFDIIEKSYKYEINSKENIHQDVSKFLVLALKDLTKQKNPWGVLTGIRPVKIPHKLYMEGKSSDEIESILKEEYLLSIDKIQIINDLAKIEINNMYPLDIKRTMLYISIPFCPSRCNYCSFISQVSKGNDKVLNDCFIALLKELESTLYYLMDKKIKITNIYIGGGTPTILDIQQLEKILSLIYKHIPYNAISEFTVEGGRPDTITKEKLELFNDMGVNRICINTQSLQDETLRKIGRNHTVRDYYKAMELAKVVGFKSINTDLILGLEGETIEETQDTLLKTVKSNPDNITIHNLSIKRSSTLHHTGIYEMQNNKDIYKINDWVQEYLSKQQYNPYYLYRQKNTQGNLENIGYTIEGKECYYNIAMISEKISVIGVGAGSTGKLYNPHNDQITRVETVKNPLIYIERIDDIIRNKRSKMNELWG